MSVQSPVPRAAPRPLPLSARAVRRIAPLGLGLGLTAALLCGCGGGSDDPSPAPAPAPTPAPAPGQTHQTLGVSVTGLAAGQSVVLQNNGAEDFTVGANGFVRTAASWRLGSSYAVTVKTQPTGQQCTVARGSGTLATDSPSVLVDCVVLPVDRNTLGGTISGVPAGYTVVLTTGGEDLALTADGGFTFPTPLAAGAAYAVTVKSKPDGTGCVVRDGAGVIAGAAVDAVQVSCRALGSVTGFWEQDQCTPGPGGTGLKNGWRISQGRPVFIYVGAGGVSYRNAQCTGVGTTMTGPLVGGFTVTQSRQEFTSDVSAYWGIRDGMTFPTLPVVLVRKGNHLCLLEDSGPPSAYPNVASVGAEVNAAIAAGRCYTPR